jgi:hypothetical protein
MKHNRPLELLIGIAEDLCGSNAATSLYAVQNLPEYQSFSDKRANGMDCVDEFNEVAVFR